MKHKTLSRPREIREPRAAAAFSDPLRRRVVLLLATRPRSLTELAVDCGVELKRLHYHVTALTKLGLVRVARRVPRAGRPIRIYAAVADSFFVPIEAMAVEPGAALSAELRASLAIAERRARTGVVFDVGDDGEPRMRTVARSTSGRIAAAERWWIVALAEDDRARLLDAIDACVRPFLARGSGRADHCLVHFAFAPRRGTGRPAPRR